jgi:hypothetical protein
MSEKLMCFGNTQHDRDCKKHGNAKNKGLGANSIWNESAFCSLFGKGSA